MFLLGMGILTDGLRAVAGSALRAVLGRAASTPLRGAFWGGAVTMLVQSSSATTMTTIGLVSAGLLAFPQAVGVIFGANVGTTGTGWLVALTGAKVSLSAAALPMVLCGALLRIVGKGRWHGAGGAIAGLGLLLAGLTLLQGGMAGVAERVQPTDFPVIAGGGAWTAAWATLRLVVVGAVMTTVMQSSSASVAATIVALQAGAIAPDQAAALVVGQNIGTSTSALIAAVGATTPARRTAVAHLLFNGITAVTVLAASPALLPFLDRLALRVDPALLMAGFHTGYNLLGAALLLPLIGPFCRLVERIVPQRGPALTQHLDRSVLHVPAVAVEAARRTIAAALAALCGRGGAASQEAEDALLQARAFLSGVADPPASAAEARRLTSVLHALDHALRLAHALRPEHVPDSAIAHRTAAVERAEEWCARARVECAVLAERIATGAPQGAATQAEWGQAVERIGRCSLDLAALRRAHRVEALESASGGPAQAPGTAGGTGTAPTGRAPAPGLALERALAEVDRVRWLDRVAHHAWRAAAHVAGEADAAADTPEN